MGRSDNPERSAALTLSSTLAGGLVVVKVDGILDATTRNQFATYLAETVEERGPGMILDLEGVSFMDSRALGLIVHQWQVSTAAQGGFALVGVQYAKTKVMWVTGLAQRLPLYDSLDEALAAIGS
ncbi:STAS domain-containing protein [Streptosporangium sp. KLBMP 9127]|nr:STAS domain-containing protein [Streptosporangium sp. KLBMP 9127]